MISGFIAMAICFAIYLQGALCNCTLQFLVGVAGYCIFFCISMMHLTNVSRKVSTVLNLLFLALLGTLTANGIWLNARYLGRIAEYRFCIIEAILMMLFVFLQMLPQKKPLKKELPESNAICLS